MKRFLPVLLSFLLLVGMTSALNVSGGGYAVSSLDAGLQTANASGAGYVAQTSLMDTVQPINANAVKVIRTSSGGGGGGGGAANGETTAPVKLAEESDSHVWGSLKANQTLKYATNLAFSNIELHFAEDTASAKISIKQYNATPKGLPDANGTAYRYLFVEHQGLEHVDNYQVDVSIPQAWLKQYNIDVGNVHLYRLESGVWKEYALKPLGTADTMYTYGVTLPGFSYYAITGVPTPPAPVVAPPSTPVPATAQEQPAAPEEQQPADFVQTQKEKGFSLPSWLIISITVLVVCVGTVVGLKQYHNFKVQEAHHLEEIKTAAAQRQVQEAQARADERKQDHDPMWQLHNYIATQRAKGTADDIIRQRLLSVGWDEFVVDMEMLRK